MNSANKSDSRPRRDTIEHFAKQKPIKHNQGRNEGSAKMINQPPKKRTTDGISTYACHVEVS